MRTARTWMRRITFPGIAECSEKLLAAKTECRQIRTRSRFLTVTFVTWLKHTGCCWKWSPQVSEILIVDACDFLWQFNWEEVQEEADGLVIMWTTFDHSWWLKIVCEAFTPKMTRKRSQPTYKGNASLLPALGIHLSSLFKPPVPTTKASLRNSYLERPPTSKLLALLAINSNILE